MLQSGNVGRYSGLGFIYCLEGGFVFRCFGALGFNFSSAKGGVLILRSASVGTECFAVLWVVVGLVWDLASSVGTERRSMGVLPVVRLVQVVSLSVGTELRPMGMASVVTFSCPVLVSCTLLPWSLAPVGTDCCVSVWGKGLGLLGFFLHGERGGVGGGGLSEGLPRYSLRAYVSSYWYLFV